MQFSRTEMVFNEASHVWLFSQAFSCLVNRQDAGAPFPKKGNLWLCLGLWKATYSLETLESPTHHKSINSKCIKHLDAL